MPAEMGQGTGLGAPDPTGAYTSGSGDAGGGGYVSPAEAHAFTQQQITGHSGVGSNSYFQQFKDWVQDEFGNYPAHHATYNRLKRDYGMGSPMMRGAEQAARRATGSAIRDYGMRANEQRVQDAANRAYDQFGNPRSGNRSQAAPFRAAKMTVAQKRQAGIYHNAAGKRVTKKAVTAGALAALVSGRKMTRNQQHLMGMALKVMSPSQKRGLTNHLALMKYPGQNVNRTQKAFNRPLKQAMQAARKVAKNARKR